MSKPHGSGKLDLSPSGIQRALEAARKAEAREAAKDAEAERKERKISQKDKEIELRRKFLKFQKRQARSKEEQRKRQEEQKKQREQEAQFKPKAPESLSAKDTSGQNAVKMTRNLGRGAINIGRVLLKAREDRKKLNQPSSEGDTSTSSASTSTTSTSPSTREPKGPKGKKNKKPPIVKLFNKIRKGVRRGTSNIFSNKPQDKSGETQEPDNSNLNPPDNLEASNRRLRRRMRRVDKKAASIQQSTPPTPSTPPITPKRNKKRNMQTGQIGENYYYSCWREEFLCELSSLRQKSKQRKKTNDEKPVDVMRGRNSIKLNPNVTETYNQLYLNESMNGASIFAKATPPMKMRTTPLSDIHLSKQPGKKSIDQLNKENRRLFLGDRSNFYSNYDLSGHVSDGSDLDSNKSIRSEAYDEDDETFRQHSRERFTAGSSDNETRKRRANVLKALAAMNQDVKKTKKKKKKKEK